MVSAQQANLSECEGQKNFHIDAIFRRNTSLSYGCASPYYRLYIG